jgi:hypothetical protein
VVEVIYRWAETAQKWLFASKTPPKLEPILLRRSAELRPSS